MLKHLPNLLTLLRFALIPILILLCLSKQYILDIFILTLSGITDILDGSIARRYNIISNFGKLMDPLADKATQICLLTVLFVRNLIPVWILWIVVFKEVCMLLGATFLYGKEVVVSSKWYGKLATVFFYIAIVMTLFIENLKKVMNKEIQIIYLNKAVYYLAVITTLIALVMYVRAFFIQGYLKRIIIKNKCQ